MGVPHVAPGLAGPASLENRANIGPMDSTVAVKVSNDVLEGLGGTSW